MDETPFAHILRDLVRRIPGALAAAIVDQEGETVDYSGALEPFDLKVAAAHWRIVLSQATEQPSFAKVEWMIVRGAKRSFLVQSLPDGYALVIALRRRAGFAPFSRPIAVCARELAKEAGWSPPKEKPPFWHAVKVEDGPQHRPRRVFAHGVEPNGQGPGLSVEVLGKVVGLRGKRERGWRVRLDSGKELTLVREPGGFWYADDEPR